MSDVNAIAAIISQYERHGWNLRRVLTHDDDFYLFTDIGDAEVVKGKFNGLWFSRASQPGSETWELRRLAGIAFALIAVIEDDMSPDEAEAVLSRVETDMFERSADGSDEP